MVCGLLLCDSCRVVLENFSYAGQSQASGNKLSSVQCGILSTHESRNSAVREELMKFKDALQIGDGDDSDGVLRVASRLFVRSDDKNFIKGRRSELVLASCLYYACRRNDLPVLLIDLSSYLGVAVCQLVSVFLQFCKEAFGVDYYEDVVDPSVFIPQFTNGLLKSGLDDESTTKVIGTAINIIASMKGDWTQTGRKLSGICGAAIYIAALSHDIPDVGEETITSILIEFANTEAACLTVEELKKSDSTLLEKPFTPRPNSDKEVVNCKHKDSKCFGYGLCEDCHVKFIEVYAAFQQAVKERKEKEENEEKKSEAHFCVESKKLLHPASTAFKAWTRMHRSKGRFEKRKTKKILKRIEELDKYYRRQEVKGD
ncbi:Transcription factor TFIIB [Hirschfeldia incana]|nr:Transcription factor TFIIB [Hirschfeldia incana]